MTTGSGCVVLRDTWGPSCSTLVAVGNALRGFDPPWIAAVAGSLALSFVGYYFAYRGIFGVECGWREKLAVFLDSIHLIRELMLRPRRHGLAVAGMALFWLTDAFSAWAALKAFGFTMNGAALIVGFGTGMVFTRRTGPLAGADVLMLCLPLTLWYSGAPLATAVVAIFTYRVLSLWVPMPFALSCMRALRAMGEGRTPHTEGTSETEGEPSLRHRRAG